MMDGWVESWMNGWKEGLHMVYKEGNLKANSMHQICHVKLADHIEKPVVPFWIIATSDLLFFAELLLSDWPDYRKLTTSTCTRKMSRF